VPTTPAADAPTIWILGDQLNRDIASLEGRSPGDCRILFVESQAKWTSKRWSASKKNFKMEDFYRWQRQRLDVLMDPDGPAGGAWNFDADNREPPPKDGRSWPARR